MINHYYNKPTLKIIWYNREATDRNSKSLCLSNHWIFTQLIAGAAPLGAIMEICRQHLCQTVTSPLTAASPAPVHTTQSIVDSSTSLSGMNFFPSSSEYPVPLIRLSQKAEVGTPLQEHLSISPVDSECHYFGECWQP